MNLKRICIIGLGLMGGSFAQALKKKGFEGTIVGYDTCINSMEEAIQAGVIDIAACSLSDAVAQTQLVIIAVPIGNYPRILEEISTSLSPNCIITDVGSVKGTVLEVAKQILPKHIHFIGGHPMTGSERGGFKAGNPFLYENAYYFLTPEADTSPHVVKIVETIVTTLGAYPVVISPQEHDLIVSRISHLPHLIAAILVNLIEQDKGISYLSFVGGGFRDTTRIASGNPQMWKDIFLSNKGEVLKSIEAFEVLLKDFKYRLTQGQGEHLIQNLENAKLIRDSIPHHGRNYISPLFEVIVSVEDKPGILAELTRLIGSYHINIKEIEILHARQDERGAVRVAFGSREDQEMAIRVLKKGGFSHAYGKDEVEHQQGVEREGVR